MRLHHATNKKFSNFDKNKRELGFHFGTKEAAIIRWKDKFKQDEQMFIIVADIVLNKALDIVSDIGDWNDLESLKEYLGMNNFEIFTDKEMQEWKSADDVRIALQRKGYDGIIYSNLFEPSWSENGDFNKSYIVFEPEQIKIVC